MSNEMLQERKPEDKSWFAPIKRIGRSRWFLPAALSLALLLAVA